MLKNDGWVVLEPYTDLPTVHFNSQSILEETMIVLERREIDHSKKYHFPVAAFKLKEWYRPYCRSIYKIYQSAAKII